MSVVLLPKSMTFLSGRWVGGSHIWANLPPWILFLLFKSYPPVMPDSHWPVQICSFVWLCILFAVPLSFFFFSFWNPFCLLRPEIGRSYSHHWAPRHRIQSLSQPHSLFVFTHLSPLSDWELLENGNWVFLNNLVPRASPGGLILADVQWLFSLWEEMELN